MPAGRNPFAALGLPPTATPEQIKVAYRTAARKVHPDAGGSDAAFADLARAAQEATMYARGERPNPFLPNDEHIVMVPHYDRHSHAPAPPPNIWRIAGLFWILPVAGVILMVSGAAGPYFLPVLVAGLSLLGIAVALIQRPWR